MILFHLHWGTQSSEANKWICRGIEVVITRRSWKPFVRKGAWVRIPPSALQLLKNNRQGCFSMGKSWDTDFGEIPKRLKGLPWKGSRSLIAARGFKSLLLRYIVRCYGHGSWTWQRTLTNKQQSNPESSKNTYKVWEKFRERNLNKVKRKN